MFLVGLHFCEWSIFFKLCRGKVKEEPKRLDFLTLKYVTIKSRIQSIICICLSCVLTSLVSLNLIFSTEWSKSKDRLLLSSTYQDLLIHPFLIATISVSHSWILDSCVIYLSCTTRHCYGFSVWNRRARGCSITKRQAFNNKWKQSSFCRLIVHAPCS